MAEQLDILVHILSKGREFDIPISLAKNNLKNHYSGFQKKVSDKPRQTKNIFTVFIYKQLRWAFFGWVFN